MHTFMNSDISYTYYKYGGMAVQHFLNFFPKEPIPLSPYRFNRIADKKGMMLHCEWSQLDDMFNYWEFARMLYEFCKEHCQPADNMGDIIKRQSLGTYPTFDDNPNYSHFDMPKGIKAYYYHNRKPHKY